VFCRAGHAGRAAGWGESLDGVIRIGVTAPPENGRATDAARAALAEALGVANTRLTLVRGLASRNKLFRLDDQPGALSMR
jgi:uncharacterized protein YggU (UPF0235/DUF167 family)